MPQGDMSNKIKHSYKSQNKGIFITFEGCDGSGKTTQMKMLETQLKNSGHDVIVTKEPGGTPLAEKIRSIILESEIKDVATEFALLCAARRDHIINLILPALQSGRLVLCDRFLDSSIVYQGLTKGLDLDLIIEIHDRLLGGLEPDLTFLLDLDPKIALSRLNNALITNNLNTKNNLLAKREINHYDDKPLDFHNKIRDNFLKVASKFEYRFLVINANQDIALIQNNLKDAVIKIQKQKLSIKQ
jgi:dTMP kinase